MYDFDNPYQRPVMPLRTTLVLHDHCEMHEKLLETCKEIKKKDGHQPLNPYSRIDVPIFFILGKKDDVICNKRVKKVYKYLRTREEN